MEIYGDGHSCASSNNITFIDSDRICFTLNNSTLSIEDGANRQFYIYFIGDQEESLEHFATVKILVDEEADSSLENILREDGVYALKPGGCKKAFHK